MKTTSVGSSLLVAFALLSTSARAAEAPATEPQPPPSAAPAPASKPAAPAPTAASASPAPAPVAPPPPAPVLVQTPQKPATAPLALGAPARSSETPFDDAGVPDDGSLGSHQNHFWLTVGERTTFVKNRGFDVFADDDALAQFTLAFGRVLYSDGPWSFASSLAWEIGGRSSDVRGSNTSLQVNRFTVSPEARYHFMRRLYAFGRLGAGAALLSSTLQDPVGGAERSRDPLRFTVDGSVGAAFEVLGHRSGLSRIARGWLVVDGGYLYTASTDLVYASSGGSPARSAPISLGELALHGATLRVTAAVSF